MSSLTNGLFGADGADVIQMIQRGDLIIFQRNGLDCSYTVSFIRNGEKLFFNGDDKIFVEGCFYLSHVASVALLIAKILGFTLCSRKQEKPLEKLVYQLK